MEVAVGNVVGIVGWIAIITAIVRHSRRRKAARQDRQADDEGLGYIPTSAPAWRSGTQSNG
jgi:hypothetical protein